MLTTHIYAYTLTHTGTHAPMHMLVTFETYIFLCLLSTFMLNYFLKKKNPKTKQSVILARHQIESTRKTGRYTGRGRDTLRSIKKLQAVPVK